MGPTQQFKTGSIYAPFLTALQLKGKFGLRVTKMISVYKASDLVSALLSTFCFCNFLMTVTIRENQLFIIEHGGYFSCGHFSSGLFIVYYYRGHTRCH